jgi:hypothetical protein
MVIDFDSNRILSKKEREERVLDLRFNQNKNYRQIANLYFYCGIGTIYHHDNNNIRKWIHKFNSHDIDGIVSRKHNNHTAPKIPDDIEKEIDCTDSFNQSKETWFEILYIVLKSSVWICYCLS